jgi:hypothetical protein
MDNLKHAHALDEYGNRYLITNHYGGAGTPVPEIVNLILIRPVPFRFNRPQQSFSLDRLVFDQLFVVVKPLPQ